VLIEQEEDGVFVAEVPSLPGCVTQGSTRGEALANAREAIAGYLESLRVHDEPIPDAASFPFPRRIAPSSTGGCGTGRSIRRLAARGKRSAAASNAATDPRRQPAQATCRRGRRSPRVSPSWNRRVRMPRTLRRVESVLRIVFTTDRRRPEGESIMGRHRPLHSQREEPVVERSGEDGGPAMSRDHRQPALLGVPEELTRAMAKLANGEDVEGPPTPVR
jgi:predicted RNase H-like HicB family nuclease